MKKTKIIYWIFTSLFAFMMMGSAIPDIIMARIAVEGLASLGYPAYFVPFIGVAKALGVIAILVPGNPRLKEWAYAGLFFDLIGATYSLIATGLPPSAWAPMALPISLGIGSYAYYHKKIKAAAGSSKTIQTASALAA
jgi:hypothetical protein